MAVENSRRTRLLVALFCGIAGLFLLLVAAGFIPDSGKQRHAPDFIVALCGMALLAAAGMAYLGMQSKSNDLLAAVLCLIFGVVAAWVSLFSTDDGFSGGVPFIAESLNLKISRWVFGASAMLCFLIASWALRRYLRRVRSAG